MKRVSTKEARKCAYADMKKDRIKTSFIHDEKNILNQPIITKRMGLLGL